MSYAYTTIPTYPSGQIGFMLCSKQGDAAGFVTPQRPPPIDGACRCAAGCAPASEQRPWAVTGEAAQRLRPLRYYTPAVHTAAFALPEFARSALAASLTN